MRMYVIYVLMAVALGMTVGSVSAAAPTKWTDLQLITHETGDTATGNVNQVSMGVRGNKIGILVDRQIPAKSTWAKKPYYNEFTYSAQGGDLGATVRQTVTNEIVESSYGAYGMYLTGMEFTSSGVPMVGCMPYAAGNTSSARVFTRTGTETWTKDIATNNVTWNHRAFHEAFTLNASDEPQFAWVSEASGSKQLFHGAKSGGVWSNTVLSTFSSDEQNAMPDLALDASGYPHVSFGVNTNYPPCVGYAWENVGGVHDENPDAPSGISNPMRYHDIEMDVNDRPMIAHMGNEAPGGGVAVTMYDGSVWTDTAAHGNSWRDYPRDGFTYDLELDGDGDPVMVVAWFDDSDGVGNRTNVWVDWCEWDGSDWTVENIATVATEDAGLVCAALEFDEVGRPFVALGLQKKGDAYKGLYIMHVLPAEGTVIIIQ